MPIKAFIIVIVLLVLVWIPVYLNYYGFSAAISITIGFVIAGIVGEKIISKSK